MCKFLQKKNIISGAAYPNVHFYGLKILDIFLGVIIVIHILSNKAGKN